jgi:hypothetical protein
MTLQPLSFINRVTRRVSLEKQEVLTLPEHLRSPLVFNEVFVAWSLVFFGVLCRSLFVDIGFIKKSLKIPKGVIRICKSKKGRKCNGQTKRTNNDLQNTTQKSKNWKTRTPLITGLNSCALEGLEVSATLVTSVVLLFSDTNIISPKYITALFAANMNKRYNQF